MGNYVPCNGKSFASKTQFDKVEPFPNFMFSLSKYNVFYTSIYICYLWAWDQQQESNSWKLILSVNEYKIGCSNFQQRFRTILYSMIGQSKIVTRTLSVPFKSDFVFCEWKISSVITDDSSVMILKRPEVFEIQTFTM